MKAYVPVLLCVLVMAATLFLVRLGAAPLRLNAEERCDDVVEVMVATGDYLLPRRHGELRLNKPPLFYWSASAASSLLGGYSLTSLRLPSALSGLGIVLLVALWGRVLGYAREGLLAAAALPVTYLFIQQARLGSFEMMLAFFSTATLLGSYFLVRRPGWGIGLGVATLFALALMTKGTPAFATALLPILVWVIGMGKKRWLANWRTVVTFAGALLAGFGWYVYLIAAVPEARKTILAVFLLPFGVSTQVEVGAKHYESPFFFLTKIWEESFPLSFLLPLVLFHVWRSRMFATESPWRLISLGVLVPLAVFSLIPQKQDHYLLPLLAPLALLSGKAAVWGLGELQGRFRLLMLRVPGWLASAMLIVGGVVSIYAFLLIADWSKAAALSMGLTILACGVMTALAAVRHYGRLGFGSAVAGFALIWGGYFSTILPVVDSFGSGRIYYDPAYRPEPWEGKFQRFPALVKLLDVKSGLKNVDDLSEEFSSNHISVSPGRPPQLP